MVEPSGVFAALVRHAGGLGLVGLVTVDDAVVVQTVPTSEAARARTSNAAATLPTVRAGAGAAAGRGAAVGAAADAVRLELGQPALVPASVLK